jgi:hypothetical protein
MLIAADKALDQTSDKRDISFISFLFVSCLSEDKSMQQSLMNGRSQ